MITPRWIIKRVKNPCPDKWPGPWFSFKSLLRQEEGQANWLSLVSYIGLHDWERVKVRYNKTLRKLVDNLK